jgi:hypothetical protein
MSSRTPSDPHHPSGELDALEDHFLCGVQYRYIVASPRFGWSASAGTGIVRVNSRRDIGKTLNLG